MVAGGQWVRADASVAYPWIPAYAGMTKGNADAPPYSPRTPALPCGRSISSLTAHTSASARSGDRPGP